jgi:phosphatidylserine decarboxylase
MKRSILVFLFIVIPKAFLSRIFGFLFRLHVHKRILYPILEKYCNAYNVNTDEMEMPPEGFRSVDSFFTRRLKKGIHVIDQDSLAVISPVDARVDQFGEITGTRILQAKNIDYLVSELIPAHIHHAFLDGMFITLYLSPSDYHRIHSPLNAFINGGLHVPGKLFPVMQYMVNGINGLFSKNERFITYLAAENGVCAVCKIGAMNVGRISVSYSNIITNKSFFRRKREILFPKEFRPHIHKGDELGIFHLGSTVILLFQKDMVILEKLREGQKVRMGQRIATINRKSER